MGKRDSKSVSAEEKKLAKVRFDKLKKAGKTPKANWAFKDTVVDNGWSSWLPKDWLNCYKLTANGLLLPCFVSPPDKKGERKRFFHKPAVEAYLGRTLTSEERGPKPRFVDEACQAQFPPDHFLKYVGSTEPAMKYMTDRCVKAHGMMIREAIANLTYTDNNGVVRPFGIPDLRYDMKAGRLEIVKTKKLCGELSTPAPEAQRHINSQVKAEQYTELSSAGSKKRKRETGSQSCKGTARAAPTKKNAAPPQAAPTGASNGAHNAAMAVYQSVRGQASKGPVAEKDIYALVGVGMTLGVDPVLLEVVPGILRRSPPERGGFGDLTLEQLDKALVLKGVRQRKP